MSSCRVARVAWTRKKMERSWLRADAEWNTIRSSLRSHMFSLLFRKLVRLLCTQSSPSKDRKGAWIRVAGLFLLLFYLFFALLLFRRKKRWPFDPSVRNKNMWSKPNASYTLYCALHPISFQEADIYAIRSFFPWKKTKELFRKKKKGAARFDLKIKNQSFPRVNRGRHLSVSNTASQ